MVALPGPPPVVVNISANTLSKKIISIITTTATDAVGRIHDRMPMTVRPDRWDAWLDPGRTDGALDLLDVPGTELEAYAVSRLVSTVGNDGPELIEPLAES